MLERRCEFLELQLKRQTTMLSDQNEHINRLKDVIESKEADSGGVLGWLRATVLLETTEYPMKDESDEFDESVPLPVGQGGVVSVCYPMREVKSDATSKVLMRRRSVDPVTGQLQMTWVVVYSSDADSKNRYVGEFALY
jgi:hypothetical protein